MDKSLKKKPIALVTGGTKRIGKAICEDLCKNGFHVIIHANTSIHEAHEVAHNLTYEGGEASAIKTDLTDITQTKSLIDTLSNQFGAVRLLVNNASVYLDDKLDMPDDEAWDTHFSLHVKAPSILADAFSKQLPSNTDGLIINMIDERVWALTPERYSYTLSKSALWTATQTMAQKLAPRIRVNAIGPGPTLPHTGQTYSEFEVNVNSLPLKRSACLEDFGTTIRYLWSMKSVTGQMICLDGGQHLKWHSNG